MPADSVPSMSSSAEKSEAKDIPAQPGTSLRARTESDSSDKSGPRFLLPGTPNSPPKILSLDEVQDVVKNIKNMALAHEIAINTDFKLTPYEPEENTLEKIIKDTIHKAFWDILKTQIESDPPCFDHAIQLLADIKECFQSIFLQNNQKALNHINEILDADLIRQQAEKGVLDFKAHANFIIHIMSLSCAPIRDEKVAELKSNQNDVVATFRGILETLSLMKLDMANCLLELSRNDVIANSVEYEKQKFKEYLEYYKDGFPATEAWLQRNKAEAQPDQPKKSTIFSAYMELLTWKPENPIPEFFDMDKDRLIALKGRAIRLCACASALAVASGVPCIAQSAAAKKQLAKQLNILLQSVTMENELDEAILNVWEQIKTVVNQQLVADQQSIMEEQAEQALKNQVLQIVKDSPVRALMWKRLITYIQLILRSNQAVPPPPGYVEYADDIEGFGTAFKRVTYYNYAVYGEYYHDILDKMEQ